jgi:hypothetical protein
MLIHDSLGLYRSSLGSSNGQGFKGAGMGPPSRTNNQVPRQPLGQLEVDAGGDIKRIRR